MASLESSVEKWSVEDCAQFLTHCASQLTPQLSSEKLAEYTANFRANDITGYNLSDEDDSAWSSLISSAGFRGAVKRMLKAKIQGTLYALL
jgi:hypothetical protein